MTRSSTPLLHHALFLLCAGLQGRCWSFTIRWDANSFALYHKKIQIVFIWENIQLNPTWQLSLWTRASRKHLDIYIRYISSKDTSNLQFYLIKKVIVNVETYVLVFFQLVTPTFNFFPFFCDMSIQIWIRRSLPRRYNFCPEKSTSKWRPKSYITPISSSKEQ